MARKTIIALAAVMAAMLTIPTTNALARGGGGGLAAATVGSDGGAVLWHVRRRRRCSPRWRRSRGGALFASAALEPSAADSIAASSRAGSSSAARRSSATASMPLRAGAGCRPDPDCSACGSAAARTTPITDLGVSRVGAQYSQVGYRRLGWSAARKPRLLLVRLRGGLREAAAGAQPKRRVAKSCRDQSEWSRHRPRKIAPSFQLGTQM